MPAPRILIAPLLLAILAMGAADISRAQTSGGTSGGTSTGGSFSGGSMSSSPGGTSTSPGRAAIPGQAGSTSAAPSTAPIGSQRTPSATTRRETYDRLPDAPGPNARTSPDNPRGYNPAAAAGAQAEFPDGRTTEVRDDPMTPGAPDADHRQLRPDSEIIPNAERATGGAEPHTKAEIREQKERTAVDTMNECMKAWEPDTHIAREEWDDTCRRTLKKPHL